MYRKSIFLLIFHKKRDVPVEEYTDTFLGFEPEDANFALESTYIMFTDKLPSVGTIVRAK
jgi:hypothetical protein